MKKYFAKYLPVEGEVKALTTEGSAHLDFLEKI